MGETELNMVLKYHLRNCPFFRPVNILSQLELLFTATTLTLTAKLHGHLGATRLRV